jgi:hypothetical protein
MKSYVTVKQLILTAILLFVLSTTAALGAGILTAVIMDTQGEPGATGAVGPTGPQGEQGVRGERGKQGRRGRQGKDGRTGQTGAAGASSTIRCSDDPNVTWLPYC